MIQYVCVVFCTCKVQFRFVTSQPGLRLNHLSSVKNGIYIFFFSPISLIFHWMLRSRVETKGTNYCLGEEAETKVNVNTISRWMSFFEFCYFYCNKHKSAEINLFTFQESPLTLSRMPVGCMEPRGVESKAKNRGRCLIHIRNMEIYGKVYEELTLLSTCVCKQVFRSLVHGQKWMLDCLCRGFLSISLTNIHKMH